MTIREISIRGFGRFQDRTLSLDDGISVIYGENESGKSTIHSFLSAMFYGMPRARGIARETDLYARCLPWKGGAYGGSITVSEAGHSYRITRDFLKDPEDLSVTDLSSQREAEHPALLLKKLLGSLSETAFRNTVCIGQLKSASGSGMAEELRSCISNLDTSGNRALNVTEAKKLLRRRKKALEAEITPDAAKNYAADVAEMKEIERTLGSPELKNRAAELEAERRENEEVRASLEREKGALSASIAEIREKLSASGFPDNQAVEACQKDVSEKADACVRAERSASGSARLIAALLFFLAAAALMVLSALSAGSDSNSYTDFALPLRMLYSGAAPVLALAGIVFLSLDIRAKQRGRAAREAFLAAAGEHFALSGEDAEKTAAGILRDVKEKTSSLLSLFSEAKEKEEALQKNAEALRLLQEKEEKRQAGSDAQDRNQWLLEQHLQHLANLKNEASALKALIGENDRIREELDAIDLAIDTLDRLSHSIRSSFGLWLNRSTSALVRGITGGAYDSISIDDDLNVSLNTEEKLIPISQISTGTMDQVYLALRLASADLMERDGVVLPLLFDDSFVNYDENRLRSALRFLSEQYRERQILIFTCHRREDRFLSEASVPHRLIEL